MPVDNLSLIRSNSCPICRQATESELRLRFGKKRQLPLEVDLRHCPHDNFLFLAGGSQSDYDDYYANVTNDSYHDEVSAGEVRSPISKLQYTHLLDALGGFFESPRRVLDFGCGGASLLMELATSFPWSFFAGFEPGPAAQIISRRAELLGLTNLVAAGADEIAASSYDLIIVSHVLEHVLDFDIFRRLSSSLAEGALLYVEVPNALRYETYERTEFLNYTDRLHVNHFTPQALARLGASYGFGHLKHFEYSFPYRDGGDYPALGMLFRKGCVSADFTSPALLDATRHYIRQQQEKAAVLAESLREFAGVLVWGAGDNFYRSMENGGPLSSLPNMVLLDRRQHEVTLNGRSLQAMDPQTGIRQYDWPVVVTVSEGRNEIHRLATGIDPSRRIVFV